VSFLEDGEDDALRVERMILHLVDKKQPFRPEPEIKVQQELFFRSRIIEQAASAVHSFEDHSNVRPLLLRMAKKKIGFEKGSQELARLFWHDHVRQSTAGAFFVFQLSNGRNEEILYALIKYDYRAVVELAHRNGQSVLREIIQAFVKEKRAVQKFCLARYRKGNIEAMVSAADRMAEAPDLTDYFENFLGVSRSRSTDELSTRLNEALRATLHDVKEHLPDGDVSAALARTKDALRGRRTVTNDDVIDAILHGAERPDDEEVVAKLQKVARGKLKRGNLTDVEFKPNAKVLKVQPRRRVRTAEDVRIEYPEDELGRSVTHEHRDGSDIFTIRTKKQLVENDTLKIPVR